MDIPVIVDLYLTRNKSDDLFRMIGLQSMTSLRKESNRTKKSVQEAKKADAYFIGVFDRECNFPDMAHVINFPSVNYFLTPFVNTPPPQLLTYHTTFAKGRDPDNPNNITKVVS